LVNCRETAAPIVTTGAVLKRRYSMARNSLGKNRCMTSKSCGTRARSTCALKKIGNGTLEDYHAIRRTRLCLLNESDQVLAKCGTNQIKRRIIEPKGQYAGVDLRTKSFERQHDMPPLLQLVSRVLRNWRRR